MEVHLAGAFRERGIPCGTVARRNQQALANSERVATAFAEGFRCLLTRDQLVGESASRALKSFQNLPGWSSICHNSAGPNNQSGSWRQGTHRRFSPSPGVSSIGPGHVRSSHNLTHTIFPFCGSD